jgi:hypothetical protein
VKHTATPPIKGSPRDPQLRKNREADQDRSFEIRSQQQETTSEIPSLREMLRARGVRIPKGTRHGR